MAYRVRITDDALADLRELYDWIAGQASPKAARGYVARVQAFLARLDMFPLRGTVRDDVRPGLRIVGFARRVSVAFLVEGDEVVILRVLYAGRQFDPDSSDADRDD